MEDKLQELVDRLKQAQGDGLRSVILYGSAAAGEHNEHFSDLNVLCVLTRVSPAELAGSGPIFEWWRKLGNPSPLLLSEEELRTSTDCFPIEFHDMQERRRVLFGKDLIQDRCYPFHIDLHKLRVRPLLDSTSVFAPNILWRQLDVQHSDMDLRMTHEMLQGGQRNAGAHHVRGEGVSEPMRIG